MLNKVKDKACDTIAIMSAYRYFWQQVSVLIVGWRLKITEKVLQFIWKIRNV